MKNSKVETFTKTIVIGIIIVFCIFFVWAILKTIEKKFGRQIESPTTGQIYLVTASDAEANIVVAMPYKIYKNDAPKTDRRLLFKVKNQFVCSNGI